MLITMAVLEKGRRGKKFLAKTPGLKYPHLQGGSALATPTSDLEGGLVSSV